MPWQHLSVMMPVRQEASVCLHTRRHIKKEGISLLFYCCRLLVFTSVSDDSIAVAEICKFLASDKALKDLIPAAACSQL